MNTLFLLAGMCLVIFVLLATYDGFYLHLWKFELFKRKESHFEHITHTIRAILFPIIVYLLFMTTDPTWFYVGIILFVSDLIVLGIDAYAEGDSRDFMGGLPRWEYILHLFANSFHFASFILIIATRLEISNDTILYSDRFTLHTYYPHIKELAEFLLPGSVLLGLVHLLLSIEIGRKVWEFILKQRIFFFRKGIS